MEDRKGRLKHGYLADLVVLSGDIEAADPEQLHEVRPATTICGGKVTYQARLWPALTLVKLTLAQGLRVESGFNSRVAKLGAVW